ncbi:cold-shock protein [Rubrivirga sp.]|uniref:cold-shock protein n=1 Tax=Rubrivirga sp. TaxID=1885344 RepID=UPI003C727C3C
MIQGTITRFNARRGVGFVRHARSEHALPFSTRNAQGSDFSGGDTVQFDVRGGKAGIAAHNVRLIRANS